MPPARYVWIGSSGCLLPLLITFNLFFGKLIFGSTGLWLGLEVVLILIFTLKIKFMISRISQQFERRGHKPPGKAIDVQAQEVEDEEDSS